jgi:hypothetical protein
MFVWNQIIMIPRAQILNKSEIKPESAKFKLNIDSVGVQSDSVLLDLISVSSFDVLVAQNEILN